MAITIVGTFEGSSTTGAAVTVNLTGTAGGDVVYGFQSVFTNAVISAPTGYTQIAADDLNDIALLRVYRKVLTTADTSVVFSAGTASAGNACTVMVLRGADITTPEDATATTANSGEDENTLPDGPSITTTTDTAWVISAIATFLEGVGIQGPSGYGNQVDVTASTGFSATSAAVTKEIATAGAENPDVWDTEVTAWLAATLAVRPAGPGDTGALFSDGDATVLFLSRVTLAAALSAAGNAPVAFLAFGGAQTFLIADGEATVEFMASSSTSGGSGGGARQELPGLVLRTRKTPVLFRRP